MEIEEEEGGGGGGGGGGEGGPAGGSGKEKAAKALVGAMAGTTTTVLITTELIEDSTLPRARALALAYVAFFLTSFLFLSILVVVLLLSARGCGGDGAVKFAERSAIAVMFVVPLLALSMKVYAVLDKKECRRSL